MIAGPTRRVFYTGDSGYFDGLRRASAPQYGPFDATLIQIGAYDAAWPDIHMTPEEGAQTHLDVRGGLLIPVHWCTFNLALHAWAEPADRLWARGQGPRHPARRAPAGRAGRRRRPAGGRRLVAGAGLIRPRAAPRRYPMPVRVTLRFLPPSRAWSVDAKGISPDVTPAQLVGPAVPPRKDRHRGSRASGRRCRRGIRQYRRERSDGVPVGVPGGPGIRPAPRSQPSPRPRVRRDRRLSRRPRSPRSRRRFQRPRSPLSQRPSRQSRPRLREHHPFREGRQDRQVLDPLCRGDCGHHQLREQQLCSLDARRERVRARPARQHHRQVRGNPPL